MIIGIISAVTEPISPYVGGNEVSILLTLISASLVTAYTIQKSKKKLHEPPGPWGFPVLGHLPLLGKNPHLTFQEMANKFGEVFQIYMGSRRTIVVNSVDMARQILVRQSEDFAGRPDFLSFQYIGEGKSMSFGPYGTRWRLHKKVARSALRMFVQNPAQPIENAILDEADALINEITEDDQPKVLQPHLFVAAGSVIYGLCFGAKTTLRQDKEFAEFMGTQRFFQETQKAGGNPADLMPWLGPLLKFTMKDFILNIEKFNSFIRKVQQPHFADYDPNHLRDITDTLIKAADECPEDESSRSGLSKEHILSTVNEIIGAGLNTTAVTLNWTMLYLLNHPEIMARAQKEIDDVLGSYLPKPEDRKNLPYIEACLYETWRFSAMIPCLLPHATTKDTTLNGYDIPEDTLVFVNMWGVGRDPTVWKDPDVFDPTRFLDGDGNVDKVKGEDTFAFGGGARRCLGELIGRLESFILLTRMLQSCNFEKVPGQSYDMESTFSFSMEPKEYKVKVSRRH